MSRDRQAGHPHWRRGRPSDIVLALIFVSVVLLAILAIRAQALDPGIIPAFLALAAAGPLLSLSGVSYMPVIVGLCLVVVVSTMVLRMPQLARLTLLVLAMTAWGYFGIAGHSLITTMT